MMCGCHSDVMVVTSLMADESRRVGIEIHCVV